MLKALTERVERLSDAAGLPPEVLTGQLKLTVTGGRRAVLENHRGILSFGSELICVAAKNGRVVLRGDGLNITAMSAQWLVIGGKIHSVEWE